MKSAGVPSLLLMEHAAEAIASAVAAYSPKRVLTVAGYGNNGADGLAASRLLKAEGIIPDILLIGDRTHASSEWKVQWDICKAAEIDFYTSVDDIRVAGMSYDLIIDALLGIGSSRDLKDDHLLAVGMINRSKEEHGAKVISVDIPTGLHPDTGRILGDAVKADETVTFFRLKSGLLLNKGRSLTGKISVVDPMPLSGIKQIISVDANGNEQDNALILNSVDDNDLQQALERDKTGNKATFGKLLCICGCSTMPGACILNARAALRAGVGMVKILSDKNNRDLLISDVPEAMFSSYNNIADVELESAIAWSDCIVIGCGLGTDPEAVDLFHRTLIIADRLSKSVVIDADGLNILSKDISQLKGLGTTVVLTPHPGEWRRLFPEYGNGYNDPDTVRTLAREYKCIIAAKDATTVISDGNEVFLNTSGNDGMATAGSGDVLAGIVGAFLASDNKDRAGLKTALAVYLHGAAGNEASVNNGNVSLMASSIIDELHTVILSKCNT